MRMCHNGSPTEGRNKKKGGASLGVTEGRGETKK